MVLGRKIGEEHRLVDILVGLGEQRPQARALRGGDGRDRYGAGA